jgi:hypothetical protein
MKKLVFLLFACIGIVNINFGQTYIEAGTVSGNWTASDSPYIINGDLLIEVGEELTIDAGVEIVFSGYYGILAKGRISALGTADNMISFLPENPEETNLIDNAERWKGIILYNQTGDQGSIMEYCEIAYTGSEMATFSYPNPFPEETTYFGALHLYNTDNFVIKNAIIHNSLGGVCEECYSSAPGAITTSYAYNFVVQNCEIYDNTHLSGLSVTEYSSGTIDSNSFHHNDGITGGGILMNFGTAMITNNDISYNSASLGKGGGIYAIGVQFIMKNNVISYNSTEQTGAGMCLQNAYFEPVLVVEGNLFHNNKTTTGEGCAAGDGGGGIWVTHLTESCLIRNNVIVNNYSYYFGGGMVMKQSKGTVINNTISNNRSKGAGGGIGAYADESLYFNNIVFGNKSDRITSISHEIGIYAATGELQIVNCLIGSGDEADMYCYEAIDTSDVLFGSPTFEEPSAGAGELFDGDMNWSLIEGSIAIDSGLTAPDLYPYSDFDYMNNNRVFNDRVDLGAIEFDAGPHTGPLDSLIFTNHDADIDASAIFEELRFDFELYPSPFNESFNILFNEQDSYTVLIFDTSGRLVYSDDLAEIENRIELEHLSSGIYLVEIQSKESTVSKWVKKQ